MQYMCLVGFKIPPENGYVAVCLVFTIEVYGAQVPGFLVNLRLECKRRERFFHQEEVGLNRAKSQSIKQNINLKIG